MKTLTFFLAVLLSVGTASAQDSARQKKINQIIEAQGLTLMFQIQLEQLKDDATEYGREIFDKTVKELDPEGKKIDPKLEAAFKRYLDKSASLWTAKELVQIWSRHYGQGLSDQELNQILSYYKSPAGKKDVAASHSAMTGFSQAMQGEALIRMNASLEELAAELKTISEKEKAK